MQIDKLVVTGKVEILTGLHIGGSKDFSPIGAVDSPVITNPMNRQPIIPGSSLKGKMRALLSSHLSESPLPVSIDKEPIEIKRLFGASNSADKKCIPARLQFYDMELTEDSVARLRNADLDLPFTEIKFENTINRGTGVANPRQQERVVAGSEFDFKLVYNVENDEELREDFKTLKLALTLLEHDYIGGSGTRGYGRIQFQELEITSVFGKVDKGQLSNLQEELGKEQAE